MSDIFADYQTAIATMLGADPYFTGTPGVPVIGEDRLDLYKEINTRVAKIGACIVVGEPGVNRREGHSYDVSLTVTVFENTKINRNVGGSGLTGRQIGIKCWSLLSDWSPGEIWRPITVQRWEGMRGGEQPMIRELEVQTSCIAYAVQDDDAARYTTQIYAPHTDGGCVPLRVIGVPGAYQWAYGEWEDIERRPLYAEHASGFAITVGVKGVAGAYQWVYGVPCPYLGGIEHFAPTDAGTSVPIRLEGAIGDYQWRFGELEDI